MTFGLSQESSVFNYRCHYLHSTIKHYFDCHHHCLFHQCHFQQWLLPSSCHLHSRWSNLFSAALVAFAPKEGGFLLDWCLSYDILPSITLLGVQTHNWSPMSLLSTSLIHTSHLTLLRYASKKWLCFLAAAVGGGDQNSI